MSSYIKFISFLGLCSLPVTSIYASPFVSIGDIADVYFTGSSSARWTSNVFRDEVSETEDLVYTVTPGFELNFGRGLSNLDVILKTAYDIVRYEDNSDVDSEMIHLRGLAAYNSSRWDLSANISFDEQQSATGVANVQSDLIKSEDTKAGIVGEYRLSPKFSLGSGFSYRKKEYIRPENQFANFDSFTVPVDVYYKWTPKLDLSVGYTHVIQDVDSYDTAPNDPNEGLNEGYDTTTHFFNVGARGILMPKLTGFFKVGFNVRDAGNTSIRRNNSESTLGLDADLAWAATAKLTSNIKLSRDFDVSGDGNATEVSSVNVSSLYLLDNNWSFSANLGYTLRSYLDGRDRNDDQYSAGLNANYSLNQYWSVSAAYSYTDNESEAAGNSFTDHTFSVSASLRY